MLLVDCRHILDMLALGPYMDAKNLKDTRTLYRSFCRVGGSNVLCAAFKAHVLVRKSLIYPCYLFTHNHGYRLSFRILSKTLSMTRTWCRGSMTSRLLQILPCPTPLSTKWWRLHLHRHPLRLPMPQQRVLLRYLKFYGPTRSSYMLSPTPFGQDSRPAATSLPR